MQAVTTPPFGIGRLAALTGTAPDTIRYYEKIGLLPGAPRSGGRQRVFGDADVQRLRFIRRARELGFGLEAIASLLALAAPGRRSCGAVRAIAARRLDEVRARLAALRRLERALADTVARCTGDAAPNCAVLSLLEAELPAPRAARCPK
jgi:MerR family mercuric resistance operon transcriptional regulator